MARRADGHGWGCGLVEGAAGVLVAPQFPFYATGVDHFTPTLREPYDRTTTVRYLIGDIQGLALYDAGGRLIDTRETR